MFDNISKISNKNVFFGFNKPNALCYLSIIGLIASLVLMNCNQSFRTKTFIARALMGAVIGPVLMIFDAVFGHRSQKNNAPQTPPQTPPPESIVKTDENPISYTQDQACQLLFNYLSHRDFTNFEAYAPLFIKEGILTKEDLFSIMNYSSHFLRRCTALGWMEGLDPTKVLLNCHLR